MKKYIIFDYERTPENEIGVNCTYNPIIAEYYKFWRFRYYTFIDSSSKSFIGSKKLFRNLYFE